MFLLSCEPTAYFLKTFTKNMSFKHGMLLAKKCSEKQMFFYGQKSQTKGFVQKLYMAY